VQRDGTQRQLDDLTVIKMYLPIMSAFSNQAKKIKRNTVPDSVETNVTQAIPNIRDGMRWQLEYIEASTVRPKDFRIAKVRKRLS